MGLRQFLTTESPLKMMKHVFYAMLKTLFVLEIFTFLYRFFGYVEKRLDKNTNFKIMMSQTRQQIIAIPILPNISRSKSDQAVKFSELKYIT